MGRDFAFGDSGRMEAKPFSWIARHRVLLIVSVAVAAVGALGVKIYLPIAARDQMLGRGDALFQAVPTPAGGHEQWRVIERRSGALDLALSDHPNTQDSWHAHFAVDLGGSTSTPVASAYETSLLQAGWSRDPACAAKGYQDGVANAGATVSSGCWTRDGFSLSVLVDDGSGSDALSVEVVMTEKSDGSA